MANWFVIVSVLVFDLVAFALAVTAERRRSSATTVPDAEQIYTYCVYSSDISTGLGIGALLFLFLSQVIVTVATRCHCCGRALRAAGPRVCALLFFVLCWLTFLIAEACLLAGSARNAYLTKYRHFFFPGEPPSCETLRKGVFAAGAAFIFITAILSEVYYILHSKARGSGAPYESTVGMSSYSRGA